MAEPATTGSKPQQLLFPQAVKHARISLPLLAPFYTLKFFKTLNVCKARTSECSPQFSGSSVCSALLSLPTPRMAGDRSPPGSRSRPWRPTLRAGAWRHHQLPSLKPGCKARGSGLVVVSHLQKGAVPHLNSSVTADCKGTCVYTCSSCLSVMTSHTNAANVYLLCVSSREKYSILKYVPWTLLYSVLLEFRTSACYFIDHSQ